MKFLVIAFVIIGLMILAAVLPLISLEFADKIQYKLPESWEPWHATVALFGMVLLGIMFLGLAGYKQFNVIQYPTPTNPKYKPFHVEPLANRKLSITQPNPKLGAPQPDLPGLGDISPVKTRGRSATEYSSPWVDNEYGSHPKSNQYGSIPTGIDQSLKSNQYGSVPTGIDQSHIPGYGVIPRGTVNGEYGVIPSLF